MRAESSEKCITSKRVTVNEANLKRSKQITKRCSRSVYHSAAQHIYTHWVGAISPDSDRHTHIYAVIRKAKDNAKIRRNNSRIQQQQQQKIIKQLAPSHLFILLSHFSILPSLIFHFIFAACKCFLIHILHLLFFLHCVLFSVCSVVWVGVATIGQRRCLRQLIHKYIVCSLAPAYKNKTNIWSEIKACS